MPAAGVLWVLAVQTPRLGHVLPSGRKRNGENMSKTSVGSPSLTMACPYICPRGLALAEFIEMSAVAAWRKTRDRLMLKKPPHEPSYMRKVLRVITKCAWDIAMKSCSASCQQVAESRGEPRLSACPPSQPTACLGRQAKRNAKNSCYLIL